MANEINIYQPRFLAEVVRTAPAIHTFFRDRFFGRKFTFATERVDMDIVKGGRTMLPYVHPNAGSVAVKMDGYRTRSYAAPLVSGKIVTTADQMLERMPGETLYSGMTPAQRAAQKLVMEYATLNDAMTRREEFMCCEAIRTGKIEVKGPGVHDIIDFELTNKVTLTNTKRWGQSGADILGDLEDWTRHLLINGFVNCDMMIVGKDAAKHLLADQKLLNYLDNRRVELGTIAPKNLPGGVMYLGHLNKPDLEIYQYAGVYNDDWTDPDHPTVKPLVGDNEVILISSGADFLMGYGACSYYDESKTLVTAQTDRMLFSYIAHDPERKVLQLDSRPLPIPDKADSWLVATVC